jgi:hypothetical protein
LQVLSTFWFKVQQPIKLGALTAEEFFGESPKWLGRGKEYRLLAEQLDIVNWYYCNKHIEYPAAPDYCYKLVVGADNELVEYSKDQRSMHPDNKCRPGRFRLLQQQELQKPKFRRPLQGEGRLPESSLRLARLLKVYLTDAADNRIPFESEEWREGFDKAAELETGEHSGTGHAVACLSRKCGLLLAAFPHVQFVTWCILLQLPAVQHPCANFWYAALSRQSPKCLAIAPQQLCTLPCCYCCAAF